jgi:hypothetical protein
LHCLASIFSKWWQKAAPGKSWPLLSVKMTG